MRKRIEIVALSGPEAEQRWAPAADAFEIGRAGTSGLQLRDEAVSKRHARIEWSGGQPVLLDLGSRNGTFVDGVAVEGATPLTHGALVTLGNSILRISLADTDAAPLGASVAETVVQRPERVPVAGATVGRLEKYAQAVQQFLAACGPGAAAADTTDALLRVLLDALDADHAALVRTGSPGIEVVASAARERIDPRAATISRTIAQQVLRSGAALHCQDRSSEDDPPRPVLCVPCATAGAPQDVLHVTRAPGRPAFDAADVQVAASLLMLQQTLKVPAAARDTPAVAGASAGAAPLIYESRAMDRVVAIIRRAAGSGATILLQGESGTGKEVLARLIHQWSPRAAGPLVRVNCASIQEALAESELFGHERGSFTGALRQHRGRFEQADGGTLLLDEIAELSPSCQSKLLRVLEEGMIERVGGERPIAVAVRIVAATNRDLRQAVAAGEFRADLLHRLAVLPITIPPLRERREDIPCLVRHFVAQLQRDGLHGTVAFDPDAVAALQQYDWPGNVRQLRNVIEHAMIQQAGDSVDHDAITQALAYHTAMDPPAGVAAGLPLEDARQVFERDYVAQVLAACGWNRTQAAQRLGIARQNLAQKMKKLGIQPPGAKP